MVPYENFRNMIGPLSNSRKPFRCLTRQPQMKNTQLASIAKCPNALPVPHTLQSMHLVFRKVFSRDIQNACTKDRARPLFDYDQMINMLPGVDIPTSRKCIIFLIFLLCKMFGDIIAVHLVLFK